MNQDYHKWKKSKGFWYKSWVIPHQRKIFQKIKYGEKLAIVKRMLFMMREVTGKGRSKYEKQNKDLQSEIFLYNILQ